MFSVELLQFRLEVGADGTKNFLQPPQMRGIEDFAAPLGDNTKWGGARQQCDGPLRISIQTNS
jgi:hypothetical protein